MRTNQTCNGCWGLKAITWTISRQRGASGNSCVNLQSAKSISSIAVPEVIPRINRFKPGDFGSSEGDGEFEVSESEWTLACSASRYLCPTCVRTRPLGAGMRPFITILMRTISA